MTGCGTVQGTVDEDVELERRVMELFNISDPALLTQEFLNEQSEGRLEEVQELLDELEAEYSQGTPSTKHTRYRPMVPAPTPPVPSPECKGLGGWVSTL